jgi:hypothetical protein
VFSKHIAVCTSDICRWHASHAHVRGFTHARTPARAHTHTHRGICNTYYVSTATVVSWTCLNVTLYVPTCIASLVNVSICVNQATAARENTSAWRAVHDVTLYRIKEWPAIQIAGTTVQLYNCTTAESRLSVTVVLLPPFQLLHWLMWHLTAAREPLLLYNAH